MKKKLSIKAELEIMKRGLERNYGPIDFSKLTIKSGTATFRTKAGLESLGNRIHTPAVHTINEQLALCSVDQQDEIWASITRIVRAA